MHRHTSARAAFTLLEIMIIVTVIGVLIAIAVPVFFRSREISSRSTCQENLHQIDQAKHQWAMNSGAQGDFTPTWSDLVGSDAYLRATPACPGHGTYEINNVDSLPSCNYAGIPGGHPYPLVQSGGIAPPPAP